MSASCTADDDGTSVITMHDEDSDSDSESERMKVSSKSKVSIAGARAVLLRWAGWWFRSVLLGCVAGALILATIRPNHPLKPNMAILDNGMLPSVWPIVVINRSSEVFMLHCSFAVGP